MLRFSSLLLVVLCIGAASSSGYEKLFKKYAHKKIMESCFGETNVKKLYSKLYHSMEECRGGHGGSSSARGSISKPSFDWDAFFGTQQRSQNPSQFFFNRQKRDNHVPFNAAKIRGIKDSFLEKLKLGTCVLQKMDVLDSSMEMNWPAIERFYQSADVEPELKEDLMEILGKCRKYSECGSNDASAGSFPAGIKQAMKFMKCEKKKKCLACLKKDLRKGASMFELEGLDGILDGSPYDEADEQMLKVLLMGIKFGDNDFAFFD